MFLMMAPTVDRLWSDYRLPSRRFRMVAASALLAWGVAAGILAVQSQTVVLPSQTVATPGSPSGAEFYLRRAEQIVQPNDAAWLQLQDVSRAVGDMEVPQRRRP